MAGGEVVIQIVAPPKPVVEVIQQSLPLGAAIVLHIERHSAMAKYVDAVGVERYAMPFGDHVSLQEAMVVTARAGRSHISESKILEAVRDCVVKVRAEETVEAALIHGFHLLARHTMSHYAMHRLRHSLQDERERRMAAESRVEELQGRISNAEEAFDEGGGVVEVMDAMRGEA